jgi:AcrR family transcriptional regulator
MLLVSTYFVISKITMKKMLPPYHHGNLKQVLLDASVDLIGTVGLAGFTLREVARRAGVSHNAPYRHFRDKDDVLNAVAAEGFNRLTESMTKAAESGSNAMERLRLSGRGYVDFALRFPQHFVVMFESPQPIKTNPESREAGERAFGSLTRYIGECQKEGSLPEGDSTRLALLAWSLVHGIAKLACNGRFPFHKKANVLAFTDMATQALLSGIACLPSKSISGPSLSPKKRPCR